MSGDITNVWKSYLLLITCVVVAGPQVFARGPQAKAALNWTSSNVLSHLGPSLISCPPPQEWLMLRNFNHVYAAPITASPKIFSLTFPLGGDMFRSMPCAFSHVEFRFEKWHESRESRKGTSRRGKSMRGQWGVFRAKDKDTGGCSCHNQTHYCVC